jgi:hypothetical protein
VFAVNVHELEIKLREALGIWGLKHEGDGISIVFTLHGDGIIVRSTFKDLGEVLELHAHRDVAVAAIVLKAVRAELKGDEGDMGGIHGLQTKSSAVAIKIGVINEVLNGLNDLQKGKDHHSSI